MDNFNLSNIESKFSSCFEKEKHHKWFLVTNDVEIENNN